MSRLESTKIQNFLVLKITRVGTLQFTVCMEVDSGNKIPRAVYSSIPKPYVPQYAPHQVKDLPEKTVPFLY